MARALPVLPVIRAEFGAGRLSYAKVRALTRIATPATEASLAELAAPMTANQLERFARAHRQVSAADDQTARLHRRLTFGFEDDGSLSGTFRLPPLAGAVLLKALRAAAADLEHSQPQPSPQQAPGVSAETPYAGQGLAPTSSSLADALLVIAEAFVGGQAADDPEAYQVIVHVGTDAITPPADSGDVSAETPAPAGQPAAPGHPADPARCHVEDGPAISVSTARMIACSAGWSWMLHDSAGKLLDLGRRRRRPNTALRRAARERDACRCRFPGCDSRRVDLHHIQYWSNGGRTTLGNLISLCRHHHMLVHDRGYLIATARDGTFTFYQPGGTALPSCPALPQAAGTDRGLPRRGHHRRDDHPGLVRRTAGPGLRHLGLLRQRRKGCPGRRRGQRGPQERSTLTLPPSGLPAPNTPEHWGGSQTRLLRFPYPHVVNLHGLRYGDGAADIALRSG